MDSQGVCYLSYVPECNEDEYIEIRLQESSYNLGCYPCPANCQECISSDQSSAKCVKCNYNYQLAMNGTQIYCALIKSCLYTNQTLYNYHGHYFCISCPSFCHRCSLQQRDDYLTVQCDSCSYY